MAPSLGGLAFEPRPLLCPSSSTLADCLIWLPLAFLLSLALAILAFAILAFAFSFAVPALSDPSRYLPSICHPYLCQLRPCHSLCSCPLAIPFGQLRNYFAPLPYASWSAPLHPAPPAPLLLFSVWPVHSP